MIKAKTKNYLQRLSIYTPTIQYMELKTPLMAFYQGGVREGVVSVTSKQKKVEER